MERETKHRPIKGRSAVRLQAVLSLLGGEPAAQVCAKFGICRSGLYKLRRWALNARRQALSDEIRGPRTPHNRLEPEREDEIRGICERHPTLSSYEMRDWLSPNISVSDEGRCYVLRNYRKMYCGDWGNFPHHDPHFRLYFSQLAKDQCPKLLPVLPATGDESINHKVLPFARRESP